MLLKNGMVLLKDRIECVDIRVKEEKIVEIGAKLSENNDEILDLKGLYIAPGAIDVHTHFNINVGIFSADDFKSGTTAALFGGTTTVIDHPGFGPKGCNLEYMVDKYMKYGETAACDYSFHGVAQEIDEHTFGGLKALKAKGLNSFKIYLTYTYKQTDKEIVEFFKMAKELDMVVAVHAENDTMIEELRSSFIKEGKTEIIYHAYSRPGDVEAEAVARLIKIAHMVGYEKLYLVHISSKEAMDEIAITKSQGKKFFVETCTQYLYLDNTKYFEADAVKYVLSPPLREQEDIESLWYNIKTGNIDVIATDHCSFTVEDKNKGADDFSKCPNGIPGVEERNLIMFSEVLNKNLTVKEYLDLVAVNPAKIFGLYNRKGSIEVGKDADLVVFKAENNKIDEKNLKSKAGYSCFNGFNVSAVIDKVILRGNLAIDNTAQKINSQIKGKFIAR
ncbi:MAG: dihydropyrimidinase [Fusobacteriaceae bacterium]|nr:dihydropyrimidinase [Fusobacteriaceae bacterium]